MEGWVTGMGDDGFLGGWSGVAFSGAEAIVKG